MLHALDLMRSFQAAKTPWQAVSKNDNETIECAPHGFAKAAFQDTLAALPIVTYEAGETVIADGSRTGRLFKERHSHGPQGRQRNCQGGGAWRYFRRTLGLAGS